MWGPGRVAEVEVKGGGRVPVPGRPWRLDQSWAMFPGDGREPWKVLEQDGATSRPVEGGGFGPRVRGLGGWRWGMRRLGAGPAGSGALGRGMGGRASWGGWCGLGSGGSALSGKAPGRAFRAKSRARSGLPLEVESSLGLEPCHTLDRLTSRFQPSAQRSVLSRPEAGRISHTFCSHDGMCRRGRFWSLCVSREAEVTGSGRGGPKGGSQPVGPLQDTI